MVTRMEVLAVATLRRLRVFVSFVLVFASHSDCVTASHRNLLHVSLLGRAERSEGKRVAELLNGWDAVLPCRADFPGEEIDGAGRQLDHCRSPVRALAFLK